MPFGNRQTSGLPLEGGTVSGAVTLSSGATLGGALAMCANNITGCGDVVANNTNGFKLVNQAGSATVPTFVPDRALTTAGIGCVAASTSLYAIVNSAQQQNWQNGTSLIGASTTFDVRNGIFNGGANEGGNMYVTDDLNMSGNAAAIGAARLRLKSSASTATISGGATYTYSNLIPAGAIITGVCARVTTTITDAPMYAAATSIVLTAVGGGATFTAGVVRVVVYYFDCTAPTS